MSSFEKGANVWYHHPQETWIPTVVLSGGSEEITVKTEDGEGEWLPVRPGIGLAWGTWPLASRAAPPTRVARRP